MKNNKSTPKANNHVGHERDSRVFWRCLCGLFGGILLAAGFVFAAGKHFDALQQSAKNVEMRRERERLKTERQRLIMEREKVLSPSQLEKQGNRIGLQNVSAAQINRLTEIVSGAAPTAATQTKKTNGGNKNGETAAAFKKTPHEKSANR